MVFSHSPDHDELSSCIDTFDSSHAASDESTSSHTSDDSNSSPILHGDATASCPNNQPPSPNQIPAEPLFILKHLGQEFELPRDDVITLAQKGMDYDRIRSRADSLSLEKEKFDGYLHFLRTLSDNAGLPLDEFVAQTDAAALAASVNHTDMNQNSTHSLSRRDPELQEFLAHYGHIKPETIPPEVWNNVADGTPLLDAYRAFENETLKVLLEAKLKASDNKARSTGSRASFGPAFEHSELELDWYSD